MYQGMNRLISLGLAVAWVTLATAPASAFNPQPETPGSVAIGLAAGQTARISVVNATDRVSGIVPCVCPVVLTLLDENGTVLTTERIEIDPGAIGSAVFEPGPRQRDTLIVRGLVEFPGPEGERLVCNCGTRSGLEIVSGQNGATMIAVPIVTSYLPAVE